MSGITRLAGPSKSITPRHMLPPKERQARRELEAEYRRRRRKDREYLAQREARRPKLTADEAVSLYRLEKAKRADRLAAQAEEAKAMYARINAVLEQAKKGGRPRKAQAPKPPASRKRGEHGNTRESKTGRWSRRSGPTQGEQ